MLLKLAAFGSLAALGSAGPGAPERLRVEYMEEPMGVDVSYPLRFSWALQHTERGEQQSACEYSGFLDIRSLSLSLSLSLHLFCLLFLLFFFTSFVKSKQRLLALQTRSRSSRPTAAPPSGTPRRPPAT